MIHRYLATGVGVLILTLAAMTWVAYRQARQGTPANPMAAALKPWWASFTLLWVCLQGAFGALTVTMKLFPLIVTLHLLGGLILLALLRAQSQRFARAAGELKVVGVSPLTWLLLLTTFGLLWFQLALGGWVSTNYAVLACTQFPGCQGSLWPAMDWQQGFTLWRALGAGRDGGYISFEALTAIHYAHRLAAYLVLAALLLLARQLYKVPALRAQALWVLALALWQLATGLSNVLYGWPLLAAVSHTGGAAGLVVVLTGALFNCRPATALRFGSKSKASRLSS
jgi:cytochrome c oxidase assembly protein subunit 15